MDVCNMKRHPKSRVSPEDTLEKGMTKTAEAQQPPQMAMANQDIA